MKDVLILGGGPVGLFAAYYAGLRQMSVTIVDSLPELGGQLTALYPEKYIYDMPGFPKVLAKDLVREMAEQGLQYGAEVFLDERCESLAEITGGFEITTLSGRKLQGRTVIITAGVGAFSPRTLGLENEELFLGKGLWYGVRDKSNFAVKNLLIVGGGDSAFDWSLALHPHAGTTTQIHRRDVFVAHEDTVRQVLASPVNLRTFYEVAELHGNGRVEAVTIRHMKTKETERIPVDAISVNIGFQADLGPLRHWGLEIEGNQIKVNERRETNRTGVFAAGDIAQFEGKLRLLATGVGEACTAVCYAKTRIDPSAHAFPGHSTNLPPPSRSIPPIQR